MNENNFIGNLVAKFGSAASSFTATFYQAGRDTLDVIMGTILPFIFFVSAFIGIIQSTGLGSWVAQILSPLASNIYGLLIISFICSVPVLSPLLAPGAAIAQVIGVLIGSEIGLGHIAPQMALPALFAINSQVVCDFIPVALSLGEAKPETVEIGVPAILVARMVTGPVGVLVGFVLSIGLF